VHPQRLALHAAMSLYSDDRRKRKWDTQDSSPSKSRPSREDGDRSGSSHRDRSDRYEAGSSRRDDRTPSSSSGYRDRGDRTDKRSASPPRGPRDTSKKSSRGTGAPTDAATAAGKSPSPFFAFPFTGPHLLHSFLSCILLLVCGLY
jgi:hypothetical protein